MKISEKTIWMFWLQGWENATELSKICLQSWIDLNPEWTVVPLSQDNIGDYLDLDEITDDFYAKKPISCTVDIINMNLLKNYGGIWIDSTVLCLKPLDDWLDDCMTSGVFAFKFDPLPPMDKAANKTRLLSTWFLAANKGNYIIDTWCREYNQYWSGRSEPTHYFDFHYLFYDLYHEDKKFRKVFDAVPAKNAEHMHYLSYVIDRPLTEELAERVLAGEFEMTKYQNVYPEKSYEGEEVVNKLYTAKHENHVNQRAEINGLLDLYKLTKAHYLGELK